MASLSSATDDFRQDFLQLGQLGILAIARMNRASPSSSFSAHQITLNSSAGLLMTLTSKMMNWMPCAVSATVSLTQLSSGTTTSTLLKTNRDSSSKTYRTPDNSTYCRATQGLITKDTCPGSLSLIKGKASRRVISVFSLQNIR